MSDFRDLVFYWVMFRFCYNIVGGVNGFFVILDNVGFLFLFLFYYYYIFVNFVIFFLG